MAHSISIVIPVYNSIDSLTIICDRSFKVFANDDVEIILVDDGSDKNTWEQIRKLKNQHGDKIKGIRLSNNFGQHNATICGLNYCTKDFIVTMDDDLQYDPEDISLLLKTLKDSSQDIVYGLPLVKQQNLIRLIGLKLLTLFFLLFREKVPKASAFRVMKKELADHIKTNKHYFVNIDVVLRWFTKHIGYCVVPHQKRTYHQSGYSALKLINLVMKAVIAYSAVPFKLFLFSFVLAILLSTLMLCSCLFWGITFQWLAMAFNVILIPLIILGFMMLFAYLYHITNHLNNRPCYNISEII